MPLVIPYHLYEMSQIGQSMETESRGELARGWAAGDSGERLLMGGGLRREKVWRWVVRAVTRRRRLKPLSCASSEGDFYGM